MDSPNITATAAAAKVGGIVVGGDFYALQGANVGNESSSADESSSDEDSSESSSGGSTDGPSDSSDDSSDHSVGHSHTEQSSDDSLGSVDNSSGFTKTQKIIVGVVVPIGVIIIGIGCAILYRIWASKRQDRAWNPRDNMVQLQNAANEIGRGDALPLTPPTYESSVYIPPLQAPKPIDLSDPDAKVPGKE
ncbi:hypothetical protein LPJ61_006769 [Coemansia biformis]|uniref:Uncharacterized protein n=1 Tax=Coemansia biformis TaxID=1286918 RepID=A0A9W7XSF6_9FUNG|nr:hypothetical protein LPJ61_006769 [Coemansia biformis]